MKFNELEPVPSSSFLSKMVGWCCWTNYTYSICTICIISKLNFPTCNHFIWNRFTWTNHTNRTACHWFTTKFEICYSNNQTINRRYSENNLTLFKNWSNYVQSGLKLTFIGNKVWSQTNFCDFWNLKISKISSSGTVVPLMKWLTTKFKCWMLKNGIFTFNKTYHEKNVFEKMQSHNTNDTSVSFVKAKKSCEVKWVKWPHSRA